MHIGALQARLEEAELDLQRTQQTLLGQVAAMGEQLRDAERRLGQRDSEVSHLEEELDKLQRAARFLRHGLEGHASHLESELGRIRSSLAFRVAGRCEQAKGLLLPEGSRRRAVFERVMAFARNSAPPRLAVEPPRHAWPQPHQVQAAPEPLRVPERATLLAGTVSDPVLVQPPRASLAEPRV
jgi:uncharacterized protein (DUF3084 family)